MNSKSKPQSYDPYQPIEQSLRFGDVINRWFLLRPRRRIVRLLKGKRVLDVCCGTGNLTAMLVAAGCQVTGVDSSPTMLSHAQRKNLAAEFIHLDATQLHYLHEFDAAIISLALHEMPSQVREQVWAGMHRAVRPAGQLIAVDFALPLRDNFIGNLASRLTEQDERSTLSYHPAHYENFTEFMHNGGLLGWMQRQDQPVVAEYRYWGGALAVVVVS